MQESRGVIVTALIVGASLIALAAVSAVGVRRLETRAEKAPAALPPADEAAPAYPLPTPDPSPSSPAYADIRTAPVSQPNTPPGSFDKLPPDWWPTRSEASVLEQIKDAKAIMLDTSEKRLESIQLARASVGPAGVDAIPGLLARRGDLAGLPIRSGPGARLTPADARILAEGSAALKPASRKDPASTLGGDAAWRHPALIPAMMQVLTAGAHSDRLTLAGHLARIPGRESSAALARIAVFDPHPEVRLEAIGSLSGRPQGEYAEPLQAGLSYPLIAVAQNAAEALVALRGADAVPALNAAWRRTDPMAPSGPARLVKEVVRIHHRSNCLMCHPASTNPADRPRDVVPSALELGIGLGFGYGIPAKLPPRLPRTFVRADVTFLKQDYSVTLSGERYDLFVRERPAPPQDEAAALARASGPTGHRFVAAIALFVVTGSVPRP